MEIKVNNVNQALCLGVEYLKLEGVEKDTRAGRVLELPFPMKTIYTQPKERVLFCPKRDANPFFHVFESLWMLCGRDDATWLDQFVSDFSSRFAEEGGIQHGAYGKRWRGWFDLADSEEWDIEYKVAGPDEDQLKVLIQLLKNNPDDRQCVLAMWDPNIDLASVVKDKPCNTHIYFTGRRGVLDMEVCNRSNDIVWGAYGANAVHMSFLQEYVATSVGLEVGHYYQNSFNYHAYLDSFDKVKDCEIDDRYLGGKLHIEPLVSEPKTFLC